MMNDWREGCRRAWSAVEASRDLADHEFDPGDQIDFGARTPCYRCGRRESDHPAVEPPDLFVRGYKAALGISE